MINFDILLEDGVMSFSAYNTMLHWLNYHDGSQGDAMWKKAWAVYYHMKKKESKYFDALVTQLILAKGDDYSNNQYRSMLDRFFMSFDLEDLDDA